MAILNPVGEHEYEGSKYECRAHVRICSIAINFHHVLGLAKRPLAGEECFPTILTDQLALTATSLCINCACLHKTNGHGCQ